MESLKFAGRRLQIRGFLAAILVCALIAFGRKTAASPALNPACPLNFFTNVASRLLSSQLKVNLNHIEIYPTNQYTPAVNRLLQVTANVLDATTTNYYPSVFRPLFWKTNEECNGVWQTNIYVVGYQYVQEPLSSPDSQIFSTPMDVSDARVPFGLSGITNNIYGVAWVIGVKKGLPNFNALEFDNCFFIERILQFNRNSSAPAAPNSLFPFGRVYTTNQMYVIGISNAIGVDYWNSYASNYNSRVTIAVQDSLSLALTNDAGFAVINPFSTNVSWTLSSWPGYVIVLPFGTNLAVAQNLSPPYFPRSLNGLYEYYSSPTAVTLGGFTFTGPCFIPESLNPPNSLNAGTPPLPRFGLAITNWLQAYIIDANNCILDYVQLGGMNGGLDINAAVADSDNNGLWSTNSFGGSTTPWGVVNQYNTSIEGGTVPAEDLDGGPGGLWANAPVPGANGNTSPSAQQAFFAAFFSPSDEAFYNGSAPAYITNINLSILAPFSPMRQIVERYVFQANDPLVHYLNSDLLDIHDSLTNRVRIASTNSTVVRYVGQINDRYMPWGNLPPGALLGSPGTEMLPTTFDGFLVDENPYNPSYKDPLVWTSDDWIFPTNQALNASRLGQVHRGTPWQTIYLKSTNILDLQSPQSRVSGIATWAVWTGDLNLADAVSMAPVQDWQIAALLASLFNTNSEASLFSANNPNPVDWENLLNGMTVVTNDVMNDFQLEYAGPQFVTATISPASSQAAEIANGIESTRASLTRQFFITPGDLFAVPQLSDQSPYLEFTDIAQVNDGINDLAYEAIPDQLLPLLRFDSIGSMTTANGQAIIQFTGDDNHVYAVQVSPNLVNWTTIGTNCPLNGIFALTNNVTANAQFYRTVLLR